MIIIKADIKDIFYIVEDDNGNILASGVVLKDSEEDVSFAHPVLKTYDTIEEQESIING